MWRGGWRGIACFRGRRPAAYKRAMEIFPYMCSVLLTALVIHWSRVNAARKPGTKVAGLFRYRDIPPRR